MSDTIEVIQPISQELIVLGEQFRKEDGLVDESRTVILTALETAKSIMIKRGKILIEARKKTRHGIWLVWLKDYARISQSTASRYMRYAAAANQSTVTSSERDTITGELIDLELMEDAEPPSVKTTKKQAKPKSESLKIRGMVYKLFEALEMAEDRYQAAAYANDIVLWCRRVEEDAKQQLAHREVDEEHLATSVS